MKNIINFFKIVVLCLVIGWGIPILMIPAGLIAGLALFIFPESVAVLIGIIIGIPVSIGFWGMIIETNIGSKIKTKIEYLFTNWIDDEDSYY